MISLKNLIKSIIWRMLSMVGVSNIDSLCGIYFCSSTSCASQYCSRTMRTSLEKIKGTIRTGLRTNMKGFALYLPFCFLLLKSIVFLSFSQSIVENYIWMKFMFCLIVLLVFLTRKLSIIKKVIKYSIKIRIHRNLIRTNSKLLSMCRLRRSVQCQFA